MAQESGAVMTTQSDFTDEELHWLKQAEQRRSGVFPPEAITRKLAQTGVVDISDLGVRLTGLGSLILSEARRNGRGRDQEHPV
jgi:hypothetical protein